MPILQCAFCSTHNHKTLPSLPRFLHDPAGDACVLTFEWRTSVICGDTSVIECEATDPSTGLRYDLASLSRGQNWVASEYQVWMLYPCVQLTRAPIFSRKISPVEATRFCCTMASSLVRHR